MISNPMHLQDNARTIFQSENIKVICRDHASETVFVTWNEGGLTINGLSFWGDRLLDRNKIAAIGIMTPTINYYPKAETLAAVPVILEAARGRRIVSYGFSQGGHGALKYSAALNADAVLAFSPRWSVDARDRGAYYISSCQYFVPGLENGTAILGDEISGRAYVFYDPFESADRFDAEMIMATGKTQRVPMPFSRHETIRHVAESRLSDDLLNICMQGRDSVSSFRNLIRRGRSRAASYQSGRIATLLQRSRPARARACLSSQTPELYRLHVQVQYAATTGCIHDITRIVESAPKEAFQVLDGVPPDDFMALWRTLNDLIVPDAEIHLARMILSQRREDLWARLHAVVTFNKYGMTELARVELTNAVEELGKQEHADVIATLASSLGLDL